MALSLPSDSVLLLQRLRYYSKVIGFDVVIIFAVFTMKELECLPEIRLYIESMDSQKRECSECSAYGQMNAVNAAHMVE